MKMSWFNIVCLTIILLVGGPMALGVLKTVFWDTTEIRVLDRQETCHLRDGTKRVEVPEGCNEANRMAFADNGSARRETVLTLEWVDRTGQTVRQDYEGDRLDKALADTGPGSVVTALVHPKNERVPAGETPLNHIFMVVCVIIFALWYVSPFLRDTVLGNANAEDNDKTILFFRQFLLKLIFFALMLAGNEALVERKFQAYNGQKIALEATVLASDGHCASDDPGHSVCRPDKGEDNRTLLTFDHPVAGTTVRHASVKLFPNGMPQPGGTVVILNNSHADTGFSTPASVSAVDLNNQRPWAYGVIALCFALFLWFSLIEWRVLRVPDFMYG